MKPCLLRQFWQLIEETQASQLVNLDDASLVQSLTCQLLESNILVDGSEANAINHYIRSKTPLIRDMAYERLAGNLS